METGREQNGDADAGGACEPSPRLPPSGRGRRRVAELVALFLVGPLVVMEWMPKRLLIPAILGFYALSMVLSFRDSTFDRRQLWDGRAVGRELPRMMMLALAAVVSITAIVLLWMPDVFLSLVRRNPILWAAIMLGYPLASVYPQEVIFRAFFFHRYRGLFGNGVGMIAASAAAFGYAHIVLENWFAVAATVAGGVLFGWTFARSKSVAATAVEHAMYGCFMFTVGLGRFFYGGAWG